MTYIVEIRSSNSLAYVITRATLKIICHEPGNKLPHIIALSLWPTRESAIKRYYANLMQLIVVYNL